MLRSTLNTPPPDPLLLSNLSIQIQRFGIQYTFQILFSILSANFPQDTTRSLAEGGLHLKATPFEEALFSAPSLFTKVVEEDSVHFQAQGFQRSIGLVTIVRVRVCVCVCKPGGTTASIRPPLNSRKAGVKLRPTWDWPVQPHVSVKRCRRRSTCTLDHILTQSPSAHKKSSNKSVCTSLPARGFAVFGCHHRC